MGELEDAIKTLLHHSTNQNKLLTLWLREQLNQQNKTPETSPPSVFNLWNVILPRPTALQVVPFNPARHKVGIANTGPANIIYRTQEFDPTTILQYFSDPVDSDAVTPGYNQHIDIGFLAAGMAVDVISVRGVWAYSLGSAAEANQNAILSIQDSLYKIATGADQRANAGMDAIRGMGEYEGVNTNSETAVAYK